MKNFKFLIKGKKYDVSILSHTGNVARLKVNDEDYVVEIERETKPDKTPIVARPAVQEPPKEIEKKTGGPKTEIKSPLPGIIVRVFVKPGDSVTKNQALFTLEAMKMENEIFAPQDAVVASVEVQEGATVNTGDVLVVLE